MIEVKNIYKSFGTLDVLKDVSLTVNKGEVVVIIGPSGSGKSTLLRCINHLETPDKGEIVVDGEVLTGKSSQIRKVRANLGMVFQQFNLFPHMNVYDNITLQYYEARGETHYDYSTKNHAAVLENALAFSVNGHL